MPQAPDDRPHRPAHDAPGTGAARGDHYFTAEPATPQQRRDLAVVLAGREVTVEVAAGVFSPGRVDPGTRVLLDAVPPPPAEGDLVDLGCGWGPVALTMALRAPGARVWAVDVNERALDLVRTNAARLGLDGVRAVTPDEVPADLVVDALWSNPPVRVGKAVLHDLLRTWTARLRAGAQAHLVVQKNLGSDSLHRWLATELGLDVERVASSKGYRVLRVGRDA